MPSKLLIAIILMLAFSCKSKHERSFYYWKSVYRTSQEEKKYLEELKVSKLYIRFFDVDWDNASSKVVPLAKIQFNEKVSSQYEVIPVVYIVNKTLLNTKLEDIDDLAYKIDGQIERIAASNGITFKELQLDCDWTNTTRDKYFDLIKVLKVKFSKRGKIISSTIRLHQVKYKNITGVPPVDRGMLMYYNMGKITPDASPNSVFNTSDAAKYIDFLPDYPLPLDIALPAFSWGIQVRNGRVIDLLNRVEASDMKNNPNFMVVDSTTFSVANSFFFRGCYFMKDDIIRFEEVSPEQCKIAAEQLKDKLNRNIGSVAIFHLDSLIISHYGTHEFEEVFNTYR